MEGASADRSQQDRPRSDTPRALLMLVVMVVIMGASIAWGLATLDCPTGKGRWGTCNPSADAEEIAQFVKRLLSR